MQALKAIIEAHNERMTSGFYEIHDIFIILGFKAKGHHDDGIDKHVKDHIQIYQLTHSYNLNDISCMIGHHKKKASYIGS